METVAEVIRSGSVRRLLVITAVVVSAIVAYCALSREAMAFSEIVFELIGCFVAWAQCSVLKMKIWQLLVILIVLKFWRLKS